MQIKSLWEEFIQTKGMPEFCTGKVEISFNNFKKIIENKEIDPIKKLIKQMIDGNIVILKNTFDLNTTKAIRDNTMAFWKKNEESFHKMHDDCPNFHRVIDANISKNYSVDRICHASYFFPWNKDDLGVSDVIMDRWRFIKEFIGLRANEYENNIPSDGVCDRIQVVLYPPKVGVLKTHSDPYHNQLTFMSGYLSTRGKDDGYKEGGFYAVGSKNQEIDFEKDIVDGDFAIGLATIKHGVAYIDPNYNESIDWYGASGRWFLGLYSNDSDFIKNRKTAVNKA